jgi:hypothetical protein
LCALWSGGWVVEIVALVEIVDQPGTRQLGDADQRRHEAVIAFATNKRDLSQQIRESLDELTAVTAGR